MEKITKKDLTIVEVTYMRQDYKDDPYGRLVPCGMINVETWDISNVIS